MSMGRIAIIAYVAFLIGYAWFKYSAAAPPEFSIAYAQSVAILVVLTGIIPFIAAYALLKAWPLGWLGSRVTGLLIGLIVCVGGYAAFWAFFISPSAPDVSLASVAVRGIGWGLVQGGLASIAADR